MDLKPPVSKGLALPRDHPEPDVINADQVQRAKLIQKSYAAFEGCFNDLTVIDQKLPKALPPEATLEDLSTQYKELTNLNEDRNKVIAKLEKSAESYDRLRLGLPESSKITPSQSSLKNNAINSVMSSTALSQQIDTLAERGAKLTGQQAAKGLVGVTDSQGLMI